MSLIKGKLARGLFATLTVLLALCMLFTGCGKQPVAEQKFEIGFGITHTITPIMIGVKSDTVTFNKDNVTFDLYYGLYDKANTKDYHNRVISYQSSEGSERIVFGIYISDSEYSWSITNDMEIEDYKNIDNHYLVREITEEELLSGEYGYTASNKSGMTYDHYEKITIPSEFLKENKGSVRIKILSFRFPENEGMYYYTSYGNEIGIDYEIIDDNTIKITRMKNF